MKIKNILFDLDGTLLNASEGIINSVVYSLEKDGVEIGNKKELETFIGPPLKDSYMKYFNYNEEEAEERILDYRYFFDKEGFDSGFLYDGVVEMVRNLSKKANIYIATTKLQKYAELTLEKFDIESCFTGVQGSTLDGSVTFKTDIIEKLVKDYNLHPKESIMIGDHLLDVQGAKDHGLTSIGVSYGFGDFEEIKTADYIVDSVEELEKRLEELLEWKE